MASISRHPKDVKLWIEKVINSCINIHQINASHRLISLYLKKYGYENSDAYLYLINKADLIVRKIIEKQYN